MIPGAVLVFGGCREPQANAAQTGATRRADIAQASPGAEAVPTPPESPQARVKAPAQIRGIYLNAYAAGSKTRLPKLMAIADSTELNTFVVDVKDEKGVHYPTQIPLARELAQKGEITISNLKTFTDTLHKRGLYAIARVVVFKDPILSKARPEWSIKTQSGALWYDKAGFSWVSAWDPNVWEYNIQIAEEVLQGGFDEIQFDYVRFPEPFPSLPPQVHKHAKGDRTDAIVQFLAKAKPRIHAKGGLMAADLFGLSPNDPKDVNIGQQWERILAISDHVLPMVYPSHYLPTHLRGVPTPNKMPYETVFNSVGIGVMRMQKLAEAGGKVARVIPWLQAFNAPWVNKNYPYGPEQAGAQIRAVYDTGLEDWIFWNPSSRYEQVMSTFARTTEKAGRTFQPSAVMTETMKVLERTGLKDARVKAVR